jgi:hypothetical protein
VEGDALRYGKKETGLRNGGFVAWGDPALASSNAGVNEASIRSGQTSPRRN